MGFNEQKIENKHHRDVTYKRPYRLTVLEMAWFALNAKYMRACAFRKEPWIAAERDQRVMEWSNGQITPENIEEVRRGYNNYCSSDEVSDQRFELKDFLNIGREMPDEK